MKWQDLLRFQNRGVPILHDLNNQSLGRELRNFPRGSHILRTTLASSDDLVFY